MNEAQFLLSLGMKPKPIAELKPGELAAPIVVTPPRTHPDTGRREPMTAKEFDGGH